jgi:hypothetical protein
MVAFKNHSQYNFAEKNIPIEIIVLIFSTFWSYLIEIINILKK